MTGVDVPTAQQVSSVRAEARINLAAIQANVRTLQRTIHTECQLWAVVKADGYGHGAVEVARACVAAGARRLCVATLSEARHLRDAGMRAPILVLGPLDAASLERASTLDVSITISGPEMLGALAQFAPTQRATLTAGAALAPAPLPVHLKLDTGMGRWGIAHSDVIAALQQLEQNPAILVEGLMTHFATADHDDQTFLNQQVTRFASAVAAVRERHPNVIAHAANSAATLRSAATHFDAVRCGIAMYGMSPRHVDPREDDLVPALSLHSYVAEIRTLAPGQSAGYGRTFVASEPCIVGEVPLGYGDGVRRALSNVGDVLIAGQRRRIVGTISMDHLTVLIDDAVCAGMPVTVLGRDGEERILAEEHARHAGTINYEIACGIATEPRLRRVYTRAQPVSS